MAATHFSLKNVSQKCSKKSLRWFILLAILRNEQMYGCTDSNDTKRVFLSKLISLIIWYCFPNQFTNIAYGPWFRNLWKYICTVVQKSVSQSDSLTWLDKSKLNPFTRWKTGLRFSVIFIEDGRKREREREKSEKGERERKCMINVWPPIFQFLLRKWYSFSVFWFRFFMVNTLFPGSKVRSESFRSGRILHFVHLFSCTFQPLQKQPLLTDQPLNTLLTNQPTNTQLKHTKHTTQTHQVSDYSVKCTPVHFVQNKFRADTIHSQPSPRNPSIASKWNGTRKWRQANRYRWSSLYICSVVQSIFSAATPTVILESCFLGGNKLRISFFEMSTILIISCTMNIVLGEYNRTFEHFYIWT